MIKRIGITAIAIVLSSGALFAQNEQIVYIDGAKYTVYTVVKGDTLYSLSKKYGLTIDQLTEANPTLAEGLKAGQNIKIPHVKALDKSSDKSSKKIAKRNKKLFRNYIVRKGDTMYSIARIYGVSVATLIADNSDIDPAHLAVGANIRIRRSEIGTVTEQDNRAQLEQQKRTMESVTTDSYSYHVVHSGEDAKSIASRFGTTVKKLLALNGFTSEADVREGLIIKVPKTSDAKSIEKTDEQTSIDKPTTEESKKEQDRVVKATFKALIPNERTEVALMLPLTTAERRQQNFIDFYQGFLLGADQLRLNGYQSHIHLYNTAHDSSRVADIIESGELKGMNLIVGPVYEDTLIPVTRYAEKHSIPVVSPLANLTQTSASNLFQMSPRPSSKYDKVKSLFDGSQRIVIISSDTVDKDYENEIMQLIGQTPYITHKYVYEHPSVIEKREKARAEGAEVAPSPSDLSPLLESDQNTLFVVLGGTEVEVDRILAALASANISLKSRSMKAAPYMVFGNNKWNRYRNIDRALFFSNNVIMLSTYHTDRTVEPVRKFSAEYIKAFGSMPSLYAYRGYDAATIFIPTLYDKIESGLINELFTPLQTPYSFTEDEQSGVRVNSEWIRINYNSNFTITTE